MNIFSQRFSEKLKQKNISQKEFAKMLGKSEDIISCYCLGKNEPPLEVFVQICKLLDESADYLLGNED